jgi:radical SAM superfamily enzyme YgiQ (UPF0313 family)
MLADPPLLEGRYTYYHPTMGILYLLGALKAHFPANEVQGCYLQGFGSLRSHVRAIERFRPDVYGLSFKSPMARVAYRTLTAVKTRFPSLEVIAGGAHASALPDEIMAHTLVDACFQGECEDTLVQLVAAVKDGRPQYVNLPGAVYRQGGDVARNPPPPLTADLDSIPWPAWEEADARIFSGALYRGRQPYLGVVVSRGCPFSCTFCSEPVRRISGRSTYRARSPASIVAEIEHHYADGVREVRLWCEELNADPAWLIEVMDGVAALGHDDLVLSSDLRADRVTAPMASAMARAGMWLVHIGMESSSDRTLAGLKKQITIAQIEHACRELTARGIRVLGYFQFYSAWQEDEYLCWETAADAENTLDWIGDLNRRGLLHYIATAVATPRLGTPLWDLAVRRGLLKGSTDEPFVYLHEGMNLPGVSPADVRRTMMRASYVKARMALRSGNVNLRDLPFYAWRNVRDLMTA